MSLWCELVAEGRRIFTQGNPE